MFPLLTSSFLIRLLSFICPTTEELITDEMTSYLFCSFLLSSSFCLSFFCSLSFSFLKLRSNRSRPLSDSCCFYPSLRFVSIHLSLFLFPLLSPPRSSCLHREEKTLCLFPCSSHVSLLDCFPPRACKSDSSLFSASPSQLLSAEMKGSLSSSFVVFARRVFPPVLRHMLLDWRLGSNALTCCASLMCSRGIS